jgi:hypothetical protein
MLDASPPVQEVVMRKFVLMLAVLVPVLSLAFTGSRAAPIGGTFVAALAGTSEGLIPFVAVVTAQDKAIAYLCNGETMAEWFRGTVQTGGAFEAQSSTRKARITAQIVARSVIGQITLEDGRVMSFRAAPVEGEAGLYRSDDTIGTARWLGGWVVSATGEQRGAVIGGGSTRPGRNLVFRGGLIDSDLPELGALRPFRVDAEFVGKL